MPILTDEEIAALFEACAVGRGRPGIFDRTVFLGRRDEQVGLQAAAHAGGGVQGALAVAVLDATAERHLR